MNHEPEPYVWYDPWAAVEDAHFVRACRDALKIEREAYARSAAGARELLHRVTVHEAPMGWQALLRRCLGRARRGAP